MSDENPTIQVRIVGATDVGLIREHNEDNFIIVDLGSGETNFLEPRDVTLTDKGAMLVVCDGMGGAAAGEVASHMAVESMRRQMLKYVADSTSADGKPAEPAPAANLPPEAQNESRFHRMSRWLRDATARANLEIWEAASADLSKQGMGTTLTGLLLLGNQIVVSQIGDSRAYLCRSGTLTQITHDQSLVNQLLDSGQITPEQAKLFEHSNVILQALGVQEDIEVVLSSETLRRGDRLMLCSDGLVGVVSDEEIQEVLASTEDLAETARKLIDLARSGGGPDNITVIVAQVGGEGLPAPTPEDVAKYQTMTLPGERPAERRVFGEGYQFGQPQGAPIGTPDIGVAQPVARVSLVVWLALFTLVITLVVLAVVLSLVGAVYTDLEFIQLVLCSYYVFADYLLVFQWFLYEKPSELNRLLLFTLALALCAGCDIVNRIRDEIEKELLTCAQQGCSTGNCVAIGETKPLSAVGMEFVTACENYANNCPGVNDGVCKYPLLFSDAALSKALPCFSMGNCPMKDSCIAAFDDSDVDSCESWL